MSKTKSGKKKTTRNVFFTIACVACLILIGSSIVLMLSYSENLEVDAGYIAHQCTTIVASKLKEAVISYEANAKATAAAIVAGSYEDENDFRLKFQRTVNEVLSPDYMFIRYFNGDEEFYSNGEPFDKTIEKKAVLDFVKMRVPVCAGVVDDREFSISAVPICIPIDGFPYCDEIVVFYPTSSFVKLAEETVDDDYTNSRFLGICTSSGETISILNKDEFDVSPHNNIFDVLRSMFNDKEIIDSMQLTVMGASNAHYKVTIESKQCVLSLSTVSENSTTIFFVTGVYQNDVLVAAGYNVIRILLGIFGVLFILLIVITVYLIIKNRNELKKALALGDTDEVLGCPNRSRFERASNDIINRHKGTEFAIVVCDINHYEYLNEQNGHEAMLGILQHLKLIYSRLLQLDETYAYLNSGRFALLLHYKEMDTLANRLKQAASIASSHGTQLSGNFALEIYGGIYCVNKGLTNQVAKMIDLAVDAEKTTNFPYDFGTFRIYNELIHQSSVQNDYIELHMDSALEHRDFRVFYQPKYHILNNKADGAEALVRWYNPEIDDYMQPGVFIPLFEANKFIVKLDKYVYERVCEYIQDAMDNNLPLVPISVNVSRITASESDFVSYYSSVKEQHGIPDGFLAIEFTESFAYEDYDMLRDIVGTLHENGFKCVIDDFGSGFSSYNILKELPMDEIKLDRFFIKQGFSNDRDLKILKSVIELGRALNMKVTQEGVETLDQLALLRSLGCHVIQGYHYSRPLTLPAFMEFLDSKGSRKQ